MSSVAGRRVRRFWMWLNRAGPLHPCEHRDRRCESPGCPCKCEMCAADLADPQALRGDPGDYDCS